MIGCSNININGGYYETFYSNPVFAFEMLEYENNVIGTSGIKIDNCRFYNVSRLLSVSGSVDGITLSNCNEETSKHTRPLHNGYGSYISLSGADNTGKYFKNLKFENCNFINVIGSNVASPLVFNGVIKLDKNLNYYKPYVEIGSYITTGEYSYKCVKGGLLGEDTEVSVYVEKNSTHIYSEDINILKTIMNNYIEIEGKQYKALNIIKNGFLCLNDNIHCESGVIRVSFKQAQLEKVWSVYETANLSENLNTPYHATKMQQEGVYEDFIQYMDEKLEYDRLQREQPEGVMMLPVIEEPQPSEALLKFKEKYLG